MNKNKGITLIALVVTIIVLLILAGITIAILTDENGIIGQARFAEFATEIGMLKEELELYKTNKIVVNNEFMGDTLSCDKSTLFYNTKPEEETNSGNIFDCLPNLKGSDYESNIEVTKGRIIFLSQDIKLLNMAIRAGLEVDPYLVIDGELLSSDVNLLLMDESGTVVIPDRVTKIGAGAFRNLEGLRTIIIPGTVKEIDNYAFSGNATLENVIMRNGVEKIGEYVFEACSNLKNVDIPNSVTSIGIACFSECTAIVEITIPNSIETLPNRLFSYCRNLEKVHLGEGTKKIDDAAFDATKIEMLELPSTINNIGESAFYNMTNLKNIKIPSSNQYYKFENGLLLTKDGKKLILVTLNLTSVIIPDSVITIARNTFAVNYRLTSVTIPKNVSNINTTFHNNIRNINVDNQNTYFKSVDGNLYDYKVEKLYRYCKNEASPVLPNTLKVLVSECFYGQNNVTNLVLPESMQTIQNLGLNGTSITSLRIPKNLTSLSGGSFFGMYKIDISVDNANANYVAVDNMFLLSKDTKTLIAVTKNLETYQIPNTVETLAGASFYNRNALKKLILPNSVKKIENAFDFCINLEEIIIPSSVTEIHAKAFTRCNKLTNIKIDKKEGEITRSPWSAPYGLRAVKWRK